MTQAEIDVILEQARRRNIETGITGILFYLDGNFLQLLEGEEPALSENLRPYQAGYAAPEPDQNA
jgi:hypothetical protein